MKALSVTQPWASVICTGLKDVENRPWQAAEAPGRILIHATATKVPGNWENYPSEYVSMVKNGRLMGQFPEYKDMPNGAIIGYVDCYQIVRDADSPWAQPDCFHWCLRDAHIFDQPIFGIKGVRGHLFDVPEIDKNNLPPSHEWECEFPDAKGSTLILPVSDAVMADIVAGADHVEYDLTGFMEELLFDPDTGKPYPFKSIEFIGRNKTLTKKFDGIECGPYLLPGDKTVELDEFKGQGVLWSFVTIYFK